MLNIPFRTDEFGKNFYIEKNGATTIIKYKEGDYEENGIFFSVNETVENEVLKISISIKSEFPIGVERLGFRLGIDEYMDSYPNWNKKYFPTALRCEKNGFWSCFMSPLGKMISVCSPSRIVSWKNEYAKWDYDFVGHRIDTSSVELINTYPQPARHPESPKAITEDPIEIVLYFSCPKNEKELYFKK